jgi:hypothetical protein
VLDVRRAVRCNSIERPLPNLYAGRLSAPCWPFVVSFVAIVIVLRDSPKRGNEQPRPVACNDGTDGQRKRQAPDA